MYVDSSVDFSSRVREVRRDRSSHLSFLFPEQHIYPSPLSGLGSDQCYLPSACGLQLYHHPLWSFLWPLQLILDSIVKPLTMYYVKRRVGFTDAKPAVKGIINWCLSVFPHFRSPVLSYRRL